MNDTHLQGLAELHHHLWRCFLGDFNAFDTHLCEAAEALHAGDAPFPDASYPQITWRSQKMGPYNLMLRCASAWLPSSGIHFPIRAEAVQLSSLHDWIPWIVIVL